MKNEKNEDVHTIVISGHWEGVSGSYITSEAAPGVGGSTHNAPLGVLGIFGESIRPLPTGNEMYV